MEYLSHPNKYLLAHLNNVAKGCVGIIDAKNLNLSLVTKLQLKELSYLIAIFHDFGKYNKDFQKKILGKEDYNEEKSYHSKISSLVCYIVLKEYCNKNDVPLIFADIGAFLIKKHHGDLDELSNWLNVDEDKNEDKLFLEQFKEILSIPEANHFYMEKLKKYSVDFSIVDEESLRELVYKNKIKFKIDFNKKEDAIAEGKKIELFLITELLFSVLVDCDKKDAAGFEMHNSIKKIPEKCVQEYLKEKIKENPKKFSPLLEINKIKNQIFDGCVNNINLSKEQKIYSITAPTGAGKTLTSLATALKLKSLIENNENYKIHYVLPFTTIIDQNYEVFKEVLSKEFTDRNENDYIMKHHYLTTENIKKQDEENRDYSFKSYMDELLFIKSWDSALVVSSYVQLLETIIGGRNSFMNKFHNVVNSIIILDEVQCISSRYWNIFRELFLELADRFNVYFIFLTATQPLIFNRFKGKEHESIELVNQNRMLGNKYLDRVHVFIDPKEKSIDEFVEEIKNLKDVKDRYLFILNTKKSSLELYKKLKEIKRFNGYEKIYLSTNLTPFDRKKKIEKILGKKKQNSEEWEIEPLEKYVVVTTQLIEAGVDISSDICYRDFAPISSLIQSAGRVNRFGEIKDKKGEISFIKLKNEEQNKLFSNYVYNREPVLEWTENVLRNNKIESSKGFYDLSKKFFEQSITKEGKAKLLCQEEEFAIKSLNFHHGFKFIEDKPTHSIFIHNKDSSTLIKDYKKIYSKREEYKDFFSWKGELKRIRKRFQKFIVEVWPNDFSKNLSWLQSDKIIGDDFFYLDVHEFPEIYNSETGFNLNYKPNPIC